MNHSLPGVKQSKSFTHLTPIAPAPLLAPRPVQVLPKPASATALTAKPLSTSSSTTPVPDLDTKSLPCIITSKQWVLPPRPKAGRKPVNAEKKKAQQQAQQAQQAAASPVPSLVSQKRQNSVTSVTKTMGDLNIAKSMSENISLAGSSVSGTSTSTVTAMDPRPDLRHQLDTATQENQKLKSIISWLKIEIEQLQRCQQNSVSPGSSGTAAAFSPQAITQDAQATVAQIHYQLHGTVVSTPATSNVSLASREVSPSTIDPKDIGMVKPRQKRQYKKKKKPTEDMKPSVKVKSESTLSPIAIPLENVDSSSGLPTVETIMNREQKDQHQSKRCKTVKLERSMSVQTQDLLSPPSYGLDRTMSTPLDFTELNPPTVSALSRTTTNTTIDPMEFGWPGRECGFCQDGGPCLCLEKGNRMKEVMESQPILEAPEELDVNQLFKQDVNDDLDEFLML